MRRRVFNLSVKNFCSGKSYHTSQKKSFEDQLIAVDIFDKPHYSVSKLASHLKEAKNEYPHRAFSVFLFNSKNELLLQRRSNFKITFKNLWSNTCCSHPLFTVEESEKKDNKGVKLAASRRLKYELGIDVKLEDLHPVEKIIYKADSDEIFEEYELDYMLFGKFDHKVEDIPFNQEEVCDIKFLNMTELSKLVNSKEITPWFNLVLLNRLNQYFDERSREELINKYKENPDGLRIINFDTAKKL